MRNTVIFKESVTKTQTSEYRTEQAPASKNLLDPLGYGRRRPNEADVDRRARVRHFEAGRTLILPLEP